MFQVFLKKILSFFVFILVDFLTILFIWVPSCDFVGLHLDLGHFCSMIGSFPQNILKIYKSPI